MKLFKSILAGAVALLAASAIAYGLNSDANRIYPVRQAMTQQTNYVRVLVNYNDPNLSTAVKFGKLPQNAFITRVAAHVTTAFNGTTPVLTVGTNTTATQIFGGSDLSEASATFQNMTSAAGLGMAVTTSGDTDLYVKYTEAVAGTAGAAVIVIEYIPNNDQ
jgi:hypothetical protein